jgi:hypothetical protein
MVTPAALRFQVVEVLLPSVALAGTSTRRGASFPQPDSAECGAMTCHRQEPLLHRKGGQHRVPGSSMQFSFRMAM